MQFNANGKLLLTGEYAVLDGAVALALPTKFGQHIKIGPSEIPGITWKSLDERNEPWFQCNISYKEIKAANSHKEDTKDRLISILQSAKILKPDFLAEEKNLSVTTQLEFNPDWGLGSSSTLISLISQWAEVNPYELLNRTFGGSGYDVACATAEGPISFQKQENTPLVERIDFNPSFKDHLYFIYLNKKQNSREGIKAYREKVKSSTLIEEISLISKGILSTRNLKEFRQLIDLHEMLISKAIELPTAKELYFPDFKGSIKSLGAWGGDFILTASEEQPIKYFEDKGYKTILPYSEMIL